MRRGLLLSFVALLICSCSSSSNQGSNVSLPLPDALIKGAATGSLEAHLVATNGTESQEATLTIADGKVSGTLMLAPGTWTIEIQFFEVASSGNLLPIAFIDFGSKEVGGGGLELSYIPTDIRFSESNGVSASLSPTVAPPSGCVSRFDCDGDGFSNFDEMKEGSDPEDPKSLPPVAAAPAAPSPSVSPTPPPPTPTPPTPTPPTPTPPISPPTITVNLTDGQVVRDLVNIVAEAKSTQGIRLLILQNPDGVADRNGLAETFQATWDTTSLPEGKDVTLKFLARDNDGRETTLTRAVHVDNVPNITSFGAAALIQSGGSAPLTWEANNFDTLSVDNGVGAVSSTGSQNVSPSTTTTYRLTATRSANGKTFTSTNDVTITVNHNPVFGGHTTLPLGQDPKSANGVTLSFDRSDIDSDTLTSTVIVYKGTACGGSSVATQTTTTGVVNVTGLDPRTDYSYTVSLSDGRGGSGSGACQSFTTADTGLVGWWRFDEGSGTTVADSSGQGNPGTLSSYAAPPGVSVAILPDWTASLIEGSALTFNARGAVVTVSNEQNFDTLLDCKHPVTFSWWEQSDGTSGHRGVISKSEVGVNHGANVHWYQKTLSLTCNSQDGGGPPPQLAVHTADISPSNGWHHYTVTYDGSLTCAGAKFYQDGLSVGGARCDAETLKDPVTNNGPVRIGAGPHFLSDGWFIGQLDEVALYNRALTTAEIRDSCQRNDPTGSTCAADDVPDQSTPSSITLPPTRAFISWRPGTTPAGKAFDHYQLCFTNAGVALSGEENCLNAVRPTVPYYVQSLARDTNNTGFLWKVRTCYNAAGTNCSAYSPVWNFSTDNSVIGWWRMDDAAGATTTADSSGYGRAGALVGSDPSTDWITGSGIAGGALNFDGVDDYVSVADNDAWAFGSNDFSINLRVRFRSLTDRQDIGHPDVAFIGNDEGAGNTNKWVFQLGGRVLSFAVSRAGEGGVFLARSPEFIPELNRWYHLAVTRSGTTYTISVNGAPVSSESDSRAIPNAVAPLTIGQAEATADFRPFLDGLMDEVAIYNRSMTTAVIKNNFCALEALAGTDPLPEVCR